MTLYAAFDEAGTPGPRYRFADDTECGLLYRPGELAIQSINYCRLRRGHGGWFHSTRDHEHDPAGYEWCRRVDPAPPAQTPTRQLVDWTR